MSHDPPTTSRPTHVQAIVRAMDLLTFLSQHGDSRLQDIAGALSLNKTTCHRLLATLADRGFVEQTSRGRYRLGKDLPVDRRHRAHKTDQALLEASFSAMRELRETTGENVYLFSHHDDVATCLDVLDGRCSSSITVRSGGTLALHVGAAPRAILAGRTDEEIWRYLTRAQRPGGDDGPSIARVYADVEHTRATGAVISRCEVDRQGMGVGASIVDDTGTPVGAISVGTLTAITSRRREERLIPSVIEAASNASRLVGSHPAP
jgi:DNA-binding IclR family transcriptional regulator